MKRTFVFGLAALALMGVTPIHAAQSILQNGSLESGGGPAAEDPMIPASWILEGNVVERSAEANLVPSGSGHALKAFQSNPTELAYQEIPIGPNVAANSVTISASLFTRPNDKVGGDAIAGLALSFYNASNIQVGSTMTTFVLDANSPASTWIPATITGPASPLSNVAKVRMTCIWVSSSGSGAAFWDDAQLKINNGPNQIVNGDFETAGLGAQSPTGIDFWTGFNDQEKSEDVAFHGGSSVKIGNDSAYNGLTQTRNDYTVEEGDELLLRAYVWQPGGNPLTGNARAGIKLEFAATTSGTLPPPTEVLAIDSNAVTDTWTQVDIGPLEVPAAASQARVTLIYVNNATAPNGYVYFDEASASLGGGNVLANPSFEDGALIPDNWAAFATGGNCAMPGQSCATKSNGEVPGYPVDDPEFPILSSARAGGDAIAGFYQDIPVTAGQMLSAHVQARVRSDFPLQGTSKAGIKIEWRGGATPSPVDITTDPSANTITALSPQNEWIPLEIQFTMPTGTEAHPRFVFLTAAGAGAGEVYFDAAELVVLNRFDGADADGDGDEDLQDFAQFQTCYNGAGAGELGFNCSVFDSTDDMDVDAADYQYFQPRITGP